MSVNSQILNIINDIEELNEETSTINGNIETINSDIEGLGNSKQNKIQVTDTIQISKLKTQYVTLSLTGQDLQTKLTSLGDDISDISNNRLSSLETSFNNIAIGDVNNLLTILNGKQTKITDNSYLSISDVSGLTTALENVQVGDINISDVINLQTTLDGKQIKITDNNYLSISDVSGLSSALENVQVGDINISDVINLQVELNKKQGTLNAFDNILIDESNNIYLFDVVTNENLQTALENVQTKISDNNYISISDVSGLTTALQNVQVGDINISDVINLQTSLNGKQDIITKNDNFIIDSMYVTPLGTKTLVNPAQTGELRASILTVEDNTLGVINVGDSISSITSDLNNKQTKITDNSYLSISDVSGLTSALENIQVGDINISDVINLQTTLNGKQTKITDNNFISISDVSGLTTTLDGKQTTLNGDTDITVDAITCGSITANLGATIRATTLIATDNLYYGPISNLVSVEGKIGELETNIGLNTITNATDISCNDISCNDLTSNTLNCSSVFNISDMIKTDSLDIERPQFDTIVIRRPTGASNIHNEFKINLIEIQVWLDNINIIQRLGSFNVTTITSMFALWTDKTNALEALMPSSGVHNNNVGGNVDAHSGTTTNVNIALIIRNIPPYYLDQIQSVILYNRTLFTGGNHSQGLAIEFYNSSSDPDLNNKLATTNVITELHDIYRFDGPSFNTYNLGFSDNISNTNITNRAHIEDNITIYDTYNTVNIGSNLETDGTINASDVNVSGILRKPNQIFFSASRVSSYRFRSVSFLIYDQVDLNIGGCYSGTNGVFMPTVSGVYFINFGFFTYLNEAFMVDLWKNNSGLINRSRRIGTGVSSYTKFEMTSLVYLEVGDYLQIRVGSGSAYLESLKQTCFFGYLLG